MINIIETGDYNEIKWPASGDVNDLILAPGEGSYDKNTELLHLNTPTNIQFTVTDLYITRLGNSRISMPKTKVVTKNKSMEEWEIRDNKWIGFVGVLIYFSPR